MRLRCRAHNQFAAECQFGVEFMHDKRQEARQVAEARKADADRARDVIPWLRQLGFRADEARRASAHCSSLLDATLGARVRAALSYLGHTGSRCGRVARPAVAGPTGPG
jgi:hypothetical protein